MITTPPWNDDNNDSACWHTIIGADDTHHQEQKHDDYDDDNNNCTILFVTAYLLPFVPLVPMVRSGMIAMIYIGLESHRHTVNHSNTFQYL